MQRTHQQQKAIEVYCRELADQLNAAGFEMKAFFEMTKGKIDIPWSQELVKEAIWKTVMSAMYPDKTSTTQMETDEVSKVFDVINRHVAETTGVSVMFPDATDLLWGDDGNKD